METYERIDEIRRLKYGFVTGAAGRGKTAVIRQIISEHYLWGRLTATTGVAAINLGSNIPTIYALLGCSDFHEIRRAFHNDKLFRAISDLRNQGYQRIVIDECSMLQAGVFDYIYTTCKKVNMGLILVGDFAQLPPVVTTEDRKSIPGPYWLFQSRYWPEFTNGTKTTNGAGIIRLKKNHRQASPDFNQLLDHLRAGDGVAASKVISKAGCVWTGTFDDLFAGTTLTGRNVVRDEINKKKFDRLPGLAKTFTKSEFGIQPKDWQDIPSQLSLKLESKVMILRNRYNGAGLEQANGTVGEIVSFPVDGSVLLKTNDDFQIVDMFHRDNSRWEHDHFGKLRKIEATAGVSYMPLTLAWALTVDKAQGLTLDSAQIGLNDRSFSRPALMYVAASRVKNPTGLRFSGTGSFADLCRVDPEVQEWI